jgi:hypothetical protein
MVPRGNEAPPALVVLLVLGVAVIACRSRRAIVALALAGCSSEPPSFTGPPASHESHRSESSDEEQIAEDDENSAPKNKAALQKGPCGGEATADGCFDCCAQRSPGALDRYGESFAQCACTSPGTCATECEASWCAGVEADAACETCLAGAASCEDSALDACEKDVTCAPMLDCATASKCSEMK